MERFATALSDALDPDFAAGFLAEALETRLGPTVRGVLVLATAAAVDAGLRVGERLSERWPEALVAGTSFEGVLAEGRVIRDRPAVLAIAWAEEHGGDDGELIPFLLESEVFGPGSVDLDEVVHVLEEARGGPLGDEDLVLLFPDAIAGSALEDRLAMLRERAHGAVFVGAAATGAGVEPANAWLGAHRESAGTLGLVVPRGNEGGTALATAGATRFASPWLRIGMCRSRWIDELEGEPALDWVRRQLGLGPAAPVEPHLDRLMVRLRAARDEKEGESDESDLDYLERYVIGVDDARGAISVPSAFERGDEVALALPDPDHARANLRAAAESLPPSPVVLQLACRARDEALHGDADLEGAWVQHVIGDRAAVGMVAPFQIGPAPDGRPRQRVHATLLAALGRN
ncbi:MAG: hypothetical protein CL931_02815 [Deltaproteobacteria bacterium]|nr:hypothetical protein [Deltaproteobacteria bacterium]